MRLLAFAALLATRTLCEELSWLQAVNTMPILENCHHLLVWHRPELFSGVQGMLTSLTSHTGIGNVDMIRQLCGRLLWRNRLMSSVGITY